MMIQVKFHITGCGRLMANGDYWGLMGIYFHPINLNGDYWGLLGISGYLGYSVGISGYLGSSINPQ